MPRRPRVTFYEDFPYALEPGAVDRQLEQLGVRSRSCPVFEDVEGFLPSKVAAMRCYASQVQDLPDLPDQALAYARELGGGRARSSGPGVYAGRR